MAIDFNLAGPLGTDGLPQVNLPYDPLQAGCVLPFSDIDGGMIRGTPFRNPPEVSEDFRTRAELDSFLDYEKFNYAAQNTSKHKLTNTTMQAAFGGGALTTNSTNITTTATGLLLQTYRHFQITAAAQTYLYFKLAFTGTWAVSNKTIDIGLFTAGAANPFTPADGAYFRLNSSGIAGVSCVSGTETTTGVFKEVFGGANFTPVLGTFYDCILTIGENSVVFWMNMRDTENYYKMMARLDTPGGSGVPQFVASLPFSVRDVNTGTTSASQGVRIASYGVAAGGFATGRDWPTAMSASGQNAIQGAGGMTQGQTTNHANSTSPTSATLSNTAAGYTTLGGRWQFAAPASAATDYCLFGYQVPTAASGLSGRNLIITGVWIDSVNTGAAVATTATILDWSIAVGSTAVSLATAESQNTRAPRRRGIGMQSWIVGAAIGAPAERAFCQFLSPLIAEPGTFVQIIVQVFLGTATASQVIRGECGLDAYWE
jgi:hypothetical protein